MGAFISRRPWQSNLELMSYFAISGIEIKTATALISAVQKELDKLSSAEQLKLYYHLAKNYFPGSKEELLAALVVAQNRLFSSRDELIAPLNSTPNFIASRKDELLTTIDTVQKYFHDSLTNRLLLRPMPLHSIFLRQEADS